MERQVREVIPVCPVEMGTLDEMDTPVPLEKAAMECLERTEPRESPV